MESATPLPVAASPAAPPSLSGRLPQRAAIFETLKALGAGRLLALGTVLLGFVVFFVFVGTQAMSPSYSLLYADLKPEDARLITDRLQARGTPFRLSQGGDAIMVPQDQIGRLRMDLTAEGMPAGNVVGYEIFDQAGSFGQTDFMSNVNLRRAMEGELARSIETLQPVRSARVHIVQPERSLFRRDEARPTASIVLGIRAGGGLVPRQVQAIRNLVAAAVPGLEPSGITIVDDRGNLLARMGDGDAGSAPADVEDLRSSYESRVKQKIVQLLERSIGPGKVDAEVTVEMNFDQVTTTAETFDPQSQVARSTQSVDEDSNREEAATDRTVSVANNLPTSQPPPGPAGTNRDRSNRSEETVNFEISRTVRNEVQRPGGIKRLSIAVQVDGVQTLQADGSSAFAERSSDELKQLEALAKSAAGFDQARGDVFQIASRRFYQAEVQDQVAPSLFEEAGLNGSHLIDLAIFALVTLAVIFLGVRPLIRRLLPQDGIGILTRPALGMLPAPGMGAGRLASDAELDERSDPAIHAASDRRQPELLAVDHHPPADEAVLIQQVAQLVDERPQDAANVVRAWLGE